MSYILEKQNNKYFCATHSFFLFNFDVKRKKEPVSPKKKRKARFLAECPVIGKADEKEKMRHIRRF